MARVGTVVPSSNTVVETTLAAFGGAIPGLHLHFARFALTAAQVDDPARAYYTSGALLGAARLLGDARCDAIVWNGSAGGLAGFAHDRKLVADIEATTGARATTSSLAILEMFRRLGVRCFAMATLNPPQANRVIAGHFAAEGFECVADASRDGIVDNFAMAAVAPEDIAARLGELAGHRPDALLVYGTNTRGAPIGLAVERATGIPVIDSVLAGLWGGMMAAGVAPAACAAWGRAYAA